ncbi:peptidoglycan-binding protein [Streptomyces noboritoensis]|uniref:Peptidoglycan-binding protein n=2 Tax=Streptomyces noboritoensis TaxID=67337 RepID=A0ABV6TCP7_9ACTN
MLNADGRKAGAVDGEVGPNTIKALQWLLQDVGLYDGPRDGIAGSKTKAAFWNYNATGC